VKVLRTHGVVRLKEGEGNSAQLVARASWDLSSRTWFNMTAYPRRSLAQRVFKGECAFWSPMKSGIHGSEESREAGLKSLVTLPLPGKQGHWESSPSFDAPRTVSPGRLSYLVNIANLLGLTLQNVACLNKSAPCSISGNTRSIPLATRSWSTIARGAFFRSNQRLSQLLGREGARLSGEALGTSSRPKRRLQELPILRGSWGEGDEPDPWLPAISWPQLHVYGPKRAATRNRARLEGHHRSKARGGKISHAGVQRQEGSLYFHASGALPGFNDALFE